MSRHRGSSKDHERPHPSEKRPQPSTHQPLRLLPPSLEKNWTADEVWALITHTERSWESYDFTDTPEYWKSIAELIPGSSAEKLRNIHLAILEYQESASLWNLDDMQKFFDCFCRIKERPRDTPEWWWGIASNFTMKTALDCRLAYNAICATDLIPEEPSEVQPQQQATTQSSVPDITNTDAPGTSSQRTYVKRPKTTLEGNQEQQTLQPLVESSTADAASVSLQTTSVTVPKTTFEGKQQHQRRKHWVPEFTSGSVNISKQRTSVESPMTTSEGKQQPPMMQRPDQSTTTFPGGASSQRTSVMPLPNWTLEDCMSLMTILTKNLHVDTDDAGAMERIALQLVGKTGEEVRHLIQKWRPQLLAALEKADRISASSSGTKGPGSSSSYQ